MKLLPIFILLAVNICNAQVFFPNDGQQKTAIIPTYDDTPVTPKNATTTVSIDFSKIVTPVSKYMYGHNSNIYMTQVIDQDDLMRNLKQLSPNVLRFPGGTISGAFFFNAAKNQRPADAPDKVLDATGKEVSLNYWFGRNTESGTMSVDNYYKVLQATNSTGIITVNYDYARYSTANDPVGAAAHLAAEWVRYDHGRTQFWEIGNEEYGDWQYGYRIKTATNKDSQPEIITGDLYGKHFNIFADSMRKAASEVGATIYLGLMLKEEAPQTWWNSTDRNWNSGIFTQTGSSPDFYIVHSYYTPYGENSNATTILNAPATVTKNNHDYVLQQITTAGHGSKPILLTEWNIFAEGSKQQVSNVGGMFAAMVLGEAIKNKYAMAVRWDLANGWNGGNDHGLFNIGDEPSVPKWNPRPAFYYMYYFQKYFGDNMVQSAVSGNDNIVAYASSFTSGQAGIVLVNKGTTDQTVTFDISNFGYGEKYYYYTLTGGTDNGEFSQVVTVNSYPATFATGGPQNFATIKAKGTAVGNGVKVNVPARSASYILIENGTSVVTGLAGEKDTLVRVFPNPARSGFVIDYPADQYSTISIHDIAGRTIAVLPVETGQTSTQFNNHLAKGLYVVKLNGPVKMLTVKVTID
ncbi:MAG: T9SS type A sorting domain-containing protein [Bacteroidota bacterium]